MSMKVLDSHPMKVIGQFEAAAALEHLAAQVRSGRVCGFSMKWDHTDPYALDMSMKVLLNNPTLFDNVVVPKKNKP